MTNMASDESQEVIREKLLRAVKKEVKHIMEESVTKKFIHEESSPIMILCGAIEACIQHGLKKRALGLFKNSTTSSALLTKISKQCESAATIVQIITAMENNQENSRKNGDLGRNGNRKSFNSKYLWIRLALIEKLLAKIVDFLVNNADKYYEKEALIADPCDGPILASLLVGPCALDYTKVKTTDHYWSDPPADELVQRHRIHSSGNHHIRPESPKRPGLQVSLGKRNASSSSEENQRCPGGNLLSAREYVESLHQNNKTQLLYGKNNVIVQPKEDVEPLAGYLSLHQGGDGLSIKWTPNQLMNGCPAHEETDDTIDRRPVYCKYAKANLLRRGGAKKFLYWDYAVTVYLDEIVYLHCHQQPDSGGTIVLVGQDGVQRPPIHFPRGGHLLAFLSCLETGLLPHGQLDPPLWSQRGKGKVFPKLRRKGSQMKMSSGSMSSQGSSLPSTGGSVTSHGSMRSQDSLTVFDECGAHGMGNGNGHKTCDSGNGGGHNGAGRILEEEEEATDYVFRIVTTFKPQTLPAEMIDPQAKNNNSLNLSNFPWPLREVHSHLRLSRGFATPPSPMTPPLSIPAPPPIASSPPQLDTMQIYAKTQQHFNNACISRNGTSRTAVKQLCDTMKNQILSRAFYGWLSYCRHLKTVRTHLSGLVNSTLVHAHLPHDASCGLTAEKWRQMLGEDDIVTEEQEIYRLVYFGGVDPEIRKEVWPFLLGHYAFGSTLAERETLDRTSQQQYERTMSEWLAVEAIVKQRDKEVTAANLAKISVESHGNGHIPLMRKDSSLSNDVFESIDSDDFEPPETVPEETSSQLVTPTGEEEKHPLNTNMAIERLQQTKEDIPHRSISPDEGIGSSVGTSLGGHPSTGGSCSVPSVSECCSTKASETRHTSAASDARTSGSLSDEVPMETDKNIIVTQATVDKTTRPRSSRGSGSSYHSRGSASSYHSRGRSRSESAEGSPQLLSTNDDGGDVSPASNASHGGVYSQDLLDNMALNLHRIDKDVQRCDRNYAFFTPVNLDKLRNIMCTYVWENLEIGYVQGMCDLLAPLLVTLNDEAKAYCCFCELMKRMTVNFPHGGAMDQHFANMRSLIQILDPEIFEHMHQNGDYTHFYFCYRWFLLDFKRELLYEDVFVVWETIWVAKHISSPHFVLFIALALVEYYREIIIDNNMDFTDIIKFFNEMAERHNAKQVLRIARDLVYKLQDLIENK